MTMENDDEKADEIEMREIQFVTGSSYEGTWNAIEKTGIGRYVTPYKVVLEGEFRNGMLHGRGSMYWPRGQRMDAVWYRGKMKQRRYTFADGLSYRENDWDYCAYPDRRFYNCVVNGLKPAGEVLKTNVQPTKIIPPYCYDTGAGMFDPHSNCVMSYRKCIKVIKIPTATESAWIENNCRKGWSEPTGHQEWLHEYWQSGTADFATLSHVSEDEEEEEAGIWWQRLTKFARHSPADMMNKN
ncbi:PREDICTED: MORN repeat-containing protein 5-like [Trachymyrmex septentrionalis]|uniref:MORN repeat-containing protein 5-like n=1 Tax=Trachymyrmex septentrionalis TaxID=34720 RepID=UPI00084ED61B|nr:PREDICTED: MORN repeat-containing protein 5-like [Trachymyrmex septentrionalis]XP_018341401.1 PREDICTED: MORN repeat-containing protein 5-like [Trachymyrmex septentrionalis]XP_018341402.1 PREDICTED: MORN repeat-containing protein 5-like [Trachymyrmex septentrionalis]XP_018341403.1 PREDICTED: MORN repeat-containing protein 5-like [Trachymyrmex septentrionalis]